MYMGDYSTGSTVFFGFTTVGSSGAATALSSGGITVYQGGSTAPNTTGVTLSASYNGVTGFNHTQVDMVATSTFYLSGKSYMAVISSGAVGTESPVGYVVAQWSVGDRSGITASDLNANSTATDALINSNSTAIQTLVNANSTATDALIAGLNDLASSDVNFQVVDVMTVDTYAEPTGVPSGTATLANKIGLIAAALGNQITVSSSAKVFYTSTGAFSFGKVLSQDSTGSTGVYTEAAASTST